jgi:hypothetical protein
MHLVAALACICDLEPGALLLPSKPLRSAVPSSPAIASRWLTGEGRGLWLGASIALTRVQRLR